MSFPNAAPPSASHGSMEPEFHEKSQPSVAGEDATVAPAPTDSTEFIRSFQQHFPEGGESALDKLADEVFVLPPQNTAVPPPEQLTLPLPGVNGNRESDETLHRRSSLSGFAQRRNSVYPNPDPYEADEFVLPHQQHPVERPQEQQSTPIPGVNGSDSLSDFVGRRNSVYADDGSDPSDEIVHRSGSLSGFVHTRNSEYRNADLYPEQQNNRLHRDSLSVFVHKRNSVYTGDNSKAEDPIHTDLARPDRNNDRAQIVKQLRLWKAVTVPDSITIYDAGCKMAAKSADVLVLTDSNGLLSGILTEKDIVKRGIAGGIDLVNTPVSKVMTKDPIFVLSVTSVVDAVQKMVQGEVKQLLVIENGEVIGLVRLEKCLFQFKSDDEKVVIAAAHAFRNRNINADSEVGDGGLTVKHFGLPNVLSVPEDTTIYEACCQMVARKVDALVIVDSNALLCGILSSKIVGNYEGKWQDIVSLVIASGIDFVNTPVSKVMIKNPVSVFSSTLAVEALQIMLQGEITKLPVIENGEVIALLDILSCLIHVCRHVASRRKHDKVIAAGFEAVGKRCSFDIWEY